MDYEFHTEGFSWKKDFDFDAMNYLDTNGVPFLVDDFSRPDNIAEYLAFHCEIKDKYFLETVSNFQHKLLSQHISNAETTDSPHNVPHHNSPTQADHPSSGVEQLSEQECAQREQPQISETHDSTP